MKDGPSIVGIAALIGDHARADMLTALMMGEALTASELAHGADVTKQTASAHLAKMLEAGLLAVESQGRHRYYRLADRDVAHLLESLMGVAYRVGATRVRSSPREPALRKARACYDHLAGEMGVLVLDSFEKRRFLRRTESGPELTARGRKFCEAMQIDLAAAAPTTIRGRSAPRPRSCSTTCSRGRSRRGCARARRSPTASRTAQASRSGCRGQG